MSDDHLSNEVTVSARLDEKGLKGAAKSRAIAALDRLVGSVLDVPTAYLERHARKVRSEPQPGLDAASVLVDILGERGAARVAEELDRKQANREAVAGRAIEHLDELAGDADQKSESKDTAELTDDWLNFFEAHAERASSDHLRDLWGRVLAGEIRKPRSFSLSTIRFISELDAEIAAKFESAVRLRLPQGMLLKPKELRGASLMDLMFLEEVGLLQGVSAFLSQEIPVSEDGFAYWRFGQVILRAKPRPGQHRVNYIAISRVGREISSILPVASDLELAEAMSDHIREAVEMMDLNFVVREHGDNVEFRTIRAVVEPVSKGQQKE